ncbi:TPA_exp: putative 3-oxo-5-alpha-steroid 4-dehydrogenase [Trichophyton benhamiae CBS 112371]|nr:TPA_exp: putative 3-oxo-5-alpha-steroid 4-dehydrogenase [Trichophyton benhamiae CBS 112371]
MDGLAGMDLVDWIRGGYVVLAASVMAVNSLKFLRDRFISYGARTLPASKEPSSKPSAVATVPPWSGISGILDRVATWDVPHSYFTHFYYCAVGVAFFWWYQLLARGWAFKLIASIVDHETRKSSMSFNQIFLCWTLFTIQACRRLYECLSFVKPSQARMHVGHWLYGFAYYIVMGVAIWIEGTTTLLSTNSPLGNAALTAPSLRSLIFIPVFIFASGIQYDCHEYLASLVKYTLPVHPAFVNIISPHYTAECMIYLSLSFLAAPPGSIINNTIFSAVILTAVQLGTSAAATKKWYSEKFGREKVKDRWIMLPFIW